MMKVELAYSDFNKSFPLILDPIPLDDGVNWQLEKPFSFVFLLDGELTTVTAPSRMITDFASIPWVARPIVGGPWGKHGRAAVIHDYTYQAGIYPCNICNQIFELGLKVSGVSAWKRFLLYRGVWIGGWKTYNYYKGLKKKGINVVEYKKVMISGQIKGGKKV